MKKEGGCEGGKVAKVRNRSRTVSIRASFNFAVVFDLIYFRFRQVKLNLYFIGNVLLKRQNAAVRSMGFSSFITRIAY
jgi:hypothetical protein